MPDGWHAGGLTVDQELSKYALERQPALAADLRTYYVSRQ